MRKNLKSGLPANILSRRRWQAGASSVGGVIGIVIVIIVLLLGAYYFWKYKIEPRLNHQNNVPSSTSTDSINIQVSATTT